MTDTGDELVCARCGGPRPPGSELCPACEDLEVTAVSYGRPNPVHERTPPHGNTTR